MTKRFILIAVLLFVAIGLKAQQVTIKGIVVSKENQQPLEDVDVYVKNLKKGAVTDAKGNFTLQLPKGKYTVVVSEIGYKTIEQNIACMKDMEVRFELAKKVEQIGEVVVSENMPLKKESVLKLNVPSQDMPVTTSVIGANLLKQADIDNVNDAVRYTTGINPAMKYGGFQTFKMRGFGNPIIMVDGSRDERMAFSNSAPVTTLAAVERIEYLKGPASVLYGHSAVGGILNIVRKQPTDKFTANFAATYGTWNTKKVVLGAGGKINNTLNYRFDASLSSSDGWRDNATKFSNVYLALDQKISDNDKLEIRVGAHDDLYGTETGLPIITKDAIYDLDGNIVARKGDLLKSFDRTQRYNDPGDYLKNRNQNVSAKYTHRFNDDSNLSLHASYSYDLIDYFSTESLSFRTSDQADYKHFYLKGENKVYIDIEHLVRDFPLRFSHETKTYQHFLEYTNKLKTGNITHNIMGGYSFMLLDRISYSGYNVGVDVSGDGLYGVVAIENPVLNQGNLESKFSKASLYKEYINSLYAHDLISFSDKLKAMIGVRVDFYSMDKQRASVPAARKLIDKTDAKTIKNTAFSYRAGLVYQPVENLSIYTSIASFFKPNRTVYNENYIYIDKDGKEFFPADGEEVFKPESGYQGEVGFKYSFQNWLNVNGTAFFIEKENIKEYLGKNNAGKRMYGQVGVVNSKGFELEANIVTPIKGLSVNAGYGFCEAKYKEFSNNEYTKSKKEGNYLRYSPRNKVYLWSFYKVPSGVLENLSVGFGLTYTDKQYTSWSNAYELPSYWLAEATLGYSFDNVFMKLKVNNLFNKSYFSNSVFSSQFIPGSERSAMLTVGVKF